MAQFSNRRSLFILIVLLVLEFACLAEMDMFASSLPLMMHEFGTTEQIIQLTLSLNFFGFFISSLFVGPLADAIGRRPILLIGALLFGLGGLLCVFSTSMPIFLIGRLIQGLGVSAPAVLGIAVIGDLYQGDKQVRMLSLVNSMITVSMAAAPLVGAYVATAFGWRVNFEVIAAMALVGFAMIWAWVPETVKPENKRRFELRDLLTNYRRLILNKEFLYPMTGVCLMVTPYFVAIGIIPLIFINTLKMPMSEYVFYQASVVGTFSILSLLMPAITKGMDLQRLTKKSLWVSLAGSVLLCAHGLALEDHPLWLTLFMCVYIAGLVLPCTVMFVKATEVYPELRASASSLAQSVRMFMMAVGTSIAGWVYNDTYAPLGLQTFLFVAVAVVICLPYTKSPIEHVSGTHAL